MFIYVLFRWLLFSLKIVPFRLLYIYSDVFYIFIYYIFGYRKKVVYSNLKNSFPDKSKEEIKKIAKKFFKHFTDITLESIKGFAVPQKKMIKRYKYVNPEITDKYYNKNKNVIMVAGHYGNWEWGTQTVQKQMMHYPIGVYKPLSNKYIDNFIRMHRAKHGAKLIGIRDTRYAFSKEYEKPVAFVLISDQSPSNSRKAYWTHFLNQDTACLHGVENYSKQFNLPVIYMSVKKVRRGYYELIAKELVNEPNKYNEGEITALFMKELEKTIIQEPEYWLWSHKRWKHKPKIDTKIITV